MVTFCVVYGGVFPLTVVPISMVLVPEDVDDDPMAICHKAVAVTLATANVPLTEALKPTVLVIDEV